MKSFFIVLATVVIASCGGEQKINRDHIPLLKTKIFELQEAVKRKSISGIDSLMSVEVLDKGLSSDSLLSLVYGETDDFDFMQFTNSEIVYTNQDAYIDCYIIDSSRSKDRPLKLILSYEDGAWLFTGFEVVTQDSIK